MWVNSSVITVGSRHRANNDAGIPHIEWFEDRDQAGRGATGKGSD